MDRLSNNDIEKYLTFGELTKKFLTDEHVKEKVLVDYNNKITQGRKATILESLYNWINHNIKYADKDKEFIKNNQFQRTAKEIWESKIATGCTDYAILFCTLARQIGLPTTLLHTAEKNWAIRFKNGEDYKIHYGHSFCECFYENKWILVDPTCRKVQENYNPNLIELNYNICGNNMFIPYLRDLDLGKKQTIKEHNLQMEQLIIEIL